MGTRSELWGTKGTKSSQCPPTVGTINLNTSSTHPSKPTSECGLGNRENPSEPTTPLPSPQYRKSEASKIRGTFVDLNFLIFHQGPREMIDLNLLMFHRGPRDMKNQKI